MLEDCTEKVLEMQESVKANINTILDALNKSSEPEVEMGLQCHEPWECGYCGYCAGEQSPSDRLTQLWQEDGTIE
jgi:hypothetical protein